MCNYRVFRPSSDFADFTDHGLVGINVYRDVSVGRLALVGDSR